MRPDTDIGRQSHTDSEPAESTPDATKFAAG
jgi:hypothetical protein